MTPAQLDKLRRIDAHLANLLSTAEKRTPGDYVKLDTYVGSKDNHHGIADFCYCGDAENEENASFFAACAGNAEAGWRATRAAIKAICAVYADLSCEPDTICVELALSIVAAFPNV